MTMIRLCPLKAMAPCWKEKCAWYLVHSKQCCLPLIASEIQKIRKDWIK
ncbi:MAG: hypothetical protein ABIH76_03665 [Candidatus Bathyarchaeota archaeon]